LALEGLARPEYHGFTRADDVQGLSMMLDWIEKYDFISTKDRKFDKLNTWIPEQS
jgi:hypothetical protein